MIGQPLTHGQLAQYSALAVPVSFAGIPLYVLAPDFYATHYGVSLSALGMALLALRLIDAVQDPFIGALSDGVFAKRRLPVMISAGVLLVMGFYLLFYPLPHMPLTWFVVTMLLATTAFSTLTINLNTLGALWRESRHDKTRITATREAFALSGLLLAVSLPGILQLHMDPLQAFIWLSLTLAVLMVAGLALFTMWFGQFGFTPRRSSPPASWRTMMTGLSRKTKHFYIIYGVSMLASAIPAILLLFFIRDRLDGEQYTGAFLLLYFMAGVVGMPLWLKVSKRYGKHRAWMMSMALAVGSFIWAFWLTQGDLWQYAIICGISGLALGADLALPPAILADHIQEQHSETIAASHFSVLAFLAKTSLAVGSATALPLLSLSGFQPGYNNSQAVLLSLSVAYALIPCMIKCIAVMMLWRHISIFNEVYYASHSDNVAVGSSRNA